MRNWMLVAVLALAPLGARAELTAIFDTRGGEGVSIEYRDGSNFRINLDAETYQLVRAGRMYLVASHQGEREVIPLSDVGEQLTALGLGGMAQKMIGAQGAALPQEVTFRPLGRGETVAGYPGAVYEVITRDSAGEQRVEAVVTSDAELAAVQEALLSMAEQAIALLGYDTGSAESRLVRQVRAQKLGALLRYGDEFRLREVLRGPVAEARLAVP